MKMIVGLGNPGRQYVGTRHNVGWVVVERLAALHQATISRRVRRRWKVVASWGEFHRGAQTVRLIKPLTMMNRSGEALAALKDQMAPAELLLVSDDVNLPLGRLRLRADGSAGGHRGLQSCFDVLGTDRVARLRLGIGGGVAGTDLAPVVLSAFTEVEQPIVEDMTGRAVEACDTWITDSIEVAMHRYNTAQDQR